MASPASDYPDPGSPAHAGIDPIRELLAVNCPGFPRTRGDRPQSDRDKGVYAEVPPHTRG